MIGVLYTLLSTPRMRAVVVDVFIMYHEYTCNQNTSYRGKSCSYMLMIATTGHMIVIQTARKLNDFDMILSDLV